MVTSRLPLARELDGFSFVGTPINEVLVRDVATGAFLATQRNVVPVGGTGSRETHLSIAIARNCNRRSARVRVLQHHGPSEPD
ncbi:DNA replication protein DnaC [Endobacter medicaginis]|uniref:DNA replication protein DnaC n=1 Tax=Endobacter medicaginis TaxID=1181271 RepID=A0A839V576_9PROT|nr:DNA replication protein DnaC [Endobacter medicaginis]